MRGFDIPRNEHVFLRMLDPRALSPECRGEGTDQSFLFITYDASEDSMGYRIDKFELTLTWLEPRRPRRCRERRGIEDDLITVRCPKCRWPLWAGPDHGGPRFHCGCAHGRGGPA